MALPQDRVQKQQRSVLLILRDRDISRVRPQNDRVRLPQRPEQSELYKTEQIVSVRFVQLLRRWSLKKPPKPCLSFFCGESSRKRR